MGKETRDLEDKVSRVMETQQAKQGEVPRWARKAAWSVGGVALAALLTWAPAAISSKLDERPTRR